MTPDRGGAVRSSRPRSMPSVAAEVGLALDYAGHSGTVVDLSDSAAVLKVGEARLTVPFGSEVRFQSATVVLAAPGEAGEVAGAAEPSERALREWRSGVAKREAVPAYVVLNDNELRRHRGDQTPDAGRTGRLQGHRTQSPGALG